MDTISIKEYIKPHQRQSVFKGVFPCDYLPTSFRLPAAFVINLSQHDEPGTHWVALYISESGSGYYFDSFGIKPTNFHIITFLKIHTKSVRYNTKQLQHITSNKCGRFCSVFIVLALRNCSVISFLSRFGVNLYVNDMIIENMYNYLNMK
jgi:hypothetical protein